MTDRVDDYLTEGLISDNCRYTENLVRIFSKMTLIGYGAQFQAFLFEIIDQNNFIEFQHGNYDNSSVLDNFDRALRLEDKIDTLEILGNDRFVDFVEQGLYEGKNLVMLTSLVRLLIDNHMYMHIVNADIAYSEKYK